MTRRPPTRRHPAVAFPVALALTLAGCGSGEDPPVCTGPGDAPARGIVLEADPTARGSYGSFRWGANNDCPAAGAEVVSVTVQGTQEDPAAGGLLTLCLPRPDLIGTEPVPLGDASRVELVDAILVHGDCTTRPRSGATPQGTATFAGLCGEAGTSFALALDGSVAATTTCGAGVEETTLRLSGRAAVAPR